MGFTLIELLAVIIILAIVAIIATPIILNVVENVRVSAGRSEASMIYSGINNYCATSAMENQLNGTTDICADGVTTTEVSTIINLGNASVTEVAYSNGKVTNLVVESNSHTFTLCVDGSFAIDDEECEIAPDDPDVGLVGDTISSTVLTQFPELATTGNGTIGITWNNEIGPYILNENKSVAVTGKLNEKATSGEYVLFSGKKYRVVDKDDNGNTKLILDGYYEEPDETIYKMLYGSNNIFSTTTGIGQKLNTDVLEWLVASSNINDRNKLVTNYTWYQNNFANGDNYKISLEEVNPTRSIEVTIGLIRVGEMLSSQSSSILTVEYTKTSSSSNAVSYWIMTSYANRSKALDISNGGSVHNNEVTTTYGLRPVLVVNSDVTITGGNGTWSSPYEI